jgi:hypothetical protein
MNKLFATDKILQASVFNSHHQGLMEGEVLTLLGQIIGVDMFN